MVSVASQPSRTDPESVSQGWDGVSPAATLGAQSSLHGLSRGSPRKSLLSRHNDYVPEVACTAPGCHRSGSQAHFCSGGQVRILSLSHSLVKHLAGAGRHPHCRRYGPARLTRRVWTWHYSSLVALGKLASLCAVPSSGTGHDRLYRAGWRCVLERAPGSQHSSCVGQRLLRNKLSHTWPACRLSFRVRSGAQPNWALRSGRRSLHAGAGRADAIWTYDPSQVHPTGRQNLCTAAAGAGPPPSCWLRGALLSAPKATWPLPQAISPAAVCLLQGQ